MVIFYPLITILILIILGFLFFFLFKKIKKGQILSSLEMVLFSIIMPRYELKKEEQRPREEKAVISQMEQIYVNFLYLRKLGFFERIFRSSPKIALEIASQLGEKDISFYVAVPRYLENAFEKYINGVYPRALVEKIPGDYTIFEPGGVTNGSYLKLKEPAIFPISTYQNLEKDPLSTITNALTKIEADEGAAIQIIIKPTKTLKKTGNKILNKIKEGKSIETALLEASRLPIFEFFLDLINVFISKPKEKKEGIMEDKKVDEKVIQAIQQKIQKPVFEANIRLVTSAQTKERAEEILEHLQGAFNQFSLFGMNSFEPKRIKTKNLKKFVFDFSFRNFNPAQKNILNIEELASIYHFPSSQTETPHLKMAKSGFAPPPVELPEKGVNLIGKITFRGEEKKVYFASRDDRRRHSYIIGQTGTGKSTLLREMIRQDIESGQGVGVIDPHGELIEATLANIPEERIEDVILFEPFDFQRPMGLNMLEYDSPEQKDFAVQEMIAIFYKLFPPEFMGPMFEHYMRNAM
ncbi:MAG: DUF87 domain-containing protein [Candidatus Nealsonbacteria bacterium]|nr:DUF87 domain-containing protein [Candidatus Nealsonbacteria bacterium]